MILNEGRDNIMCGVWSAMWVWRDFGSRQLRYIDWVCIIISDDDDVYDDVSKIMV